MLFALENKKIKKAAPLNTSTWSIDSWGKDHYLTILNIILEVSKQSA